MTKHECAVVMAYTGTSMLVGKDFGIYHKYVEDIMGRPVWTHEMYGLAEEIKNRAREDFLRLCREAVNDEQLPEPLTDKEQRIFLAAMRRELDVCKEVDKGFPTREAYEDTLESLCREITRKVKGALWT